MELADSPRRKRAAPKRILERILAVVLCMTVAPLELVLVADTLYRASSDP
jgi:hypothetical protein